MSQMNWRKNIQEAMNEVSGGTRYLFLFFYQPDDMGSTKTFDENFKDDKVIRVIERETAAVKFNVKESKDIAKKYSVDWTPTCIIADEKGTELERWVGYLPSEDFIAQMMLSGALADFHLEKHAEAVSELERLIEDNPKSEFIPEAEYFLGVARFKKDGDMYALAECCRKLNEKYPNSLWAKKGSVWAHLAIGKPFVPFSEGTSLGGGQY